MNTKITQEDSSNEETPLIEILEAMLMTLKRCRKSLIEAERSIPDTSATEG